MSVKRIDVLIAHNRYNVISHFSRALARALKRIGFSVRSLTVDRGRFYKAFHTMQADPSDLTLSYSSIRLGDTALAEAAPTPHLSLLVDHLYYFPDLLQSSRSLVTLCDRDDEKLVPHECKKRVLFMPHAVDTSELVSNPEEERPIDLLFCGSYVSPEKVRASWKKKLTREERALVETVVEEARACDLDVASLFYKIAPEHPRAFLLLVEIEMLLRAIDRTALLLALRPFQPHLYGKGVTSLAALGFSHLYPPVSFKETKRLMARAKMVINSIPSLRYGLHERILYGVAQGALPITTKTRGIDGLIKAKEALVCYELNHLEALEHEVRRLLAHPRERHERVERLRTEFLAHHTFDHRAELLARWWESLS